MELFNFYILPISAFIPLILGFIWYRPNVFGHRLANATGEPIHQITQPKSIGKIGLIYLFSLLLSYVMMLLSVHQIGVFQLFFLDPSFADASSEFKTYTTDFLAQYGERHRTFGHGLIHGAEASFCFSLAILGISALLTGKPLKSIWVHVGFWVTTCSLVAGVNCAFL